MLALQYQTAIELLQLPLPVAFQSGAPLSGVTSAPGDRLTKVGKLPSCLSSQIIIHHQHLKYIITHEPPTGTRKPIVPSSTPSLSNVSPVPGLPACLHLSSPAEPASDPAPYQWSALYTTRLPAPVPLDLESRPPCFIVTPPPQHSPFTGAFVCVTPAA
ncbi:hypothetical protein F4780DRAFT_139231 [Xylariomycetidae sp. FL0641]|nr:hypothetical protein F4780DRAFT_139231 [Xylariomycetidae sp. FL0641]